MKLDSNMILNGAVAAVVGALALKYAQDKEWL